MQSNYPEPVEKFSQSLFDTLCKTEFFSENDITSEVVFQKAKGHIQKAVFESWLEDGETKMTEEILETLLRKIMAENLLHSLHEKGMIDYVEDENGEEVFFLTEKGNRIADILEL